MAKRTALRPAHWTWMKDFSFDPGVKVGTTSNSITISPHPLRPGDDEIVARRVAEVLSAG